MQTTNTLEEEEETITVAIVVCTTSFHNIVIQMILNFVKNSINEVLMQIFLRIKEFCNRNSDIIHYFERINDFLVTDTSATESIYSPT